MIKQFEGKRNIDDKWLVGKSSLEMKLTNAPSFNLIVCKKIAQNSAQPIFVKNNA
jgi:hypothetical protein